MGRDGRGVRAASESSIEITFQYQGQRCRERLNLKPTAANLRRAEQHKAAIELAIEQGTFDYSVTFPESKRAAKFAKPVDRQNLGEYLAEWIDGRKSQLKASTAAHYERLITAQLVPMFGHLRLSELSKRHVREKLSALSVSNKTLANLQSCLRSALADAVEDEFLEANPMAGWNYRNKEVLKEEDDVDPFSMAEQAAILAAAPKDRRPQIQFALWTGLRPSELIALEWGDIDWIGNEIRIVRAKTRAASEPESPKTSSGRRSVKLLAPARDALLQQKPATFLAGGRIFTNPVSGAPWDHSEQIRKLLWAPVMKKSGVRYRRPYQTRHTFASMMLSAGEHPMWVAKQMGHKDWTMIARVYGRWMPSADLEAGQKAVQLFAGNDSTMTTMGIDPALLAGARKDTRLAP